MAAFIAVAVVGPIWGVRQLDAESTAQTNLSRAQGSLDALVRDQLSEEIGLRGFLATRDRSFLEPDGPPSTQFSKDEVALESDIAAVGLKDAQPLVHSIADWHEKWESAIALPMLLGRADPNDPSIQKYGKVLSDQLRGSSVNLREQLATASTFGQESLRRTINWTVAISSAVVAIFAISAVFLALARSSTLQRLQQQRSLINALQQTLRVGGTKLPRTEIGFAYASATAEALVGGDLLDSWRDGESSGWFLIADASGKGIQAARHSAFVQYAVRALAAGTDDPGSVVERFNRLFIDTFDDPGIFVVLFLGRYDSRSKVLRYVGAGHSTAFVRRGTAIQQLHPTGPIVGLEADSEFGVNAVRLRLGDTVLLATDGLTESRDADGAFLGDEGVERMLASAPMDAQGICDLMVAEAESRADGQIADDLAIIAINVVSEEDGGDTVFSTMEAAQDR